MKSNIVKKKIKRLSSKFLGNRKWYQFVEFENGINTGPYANEKAELRTKLFLSFLENYQLKADDKVLDLGCNAGLFSLICAQKVKSVIGVESDNSFFKQAIFVREYWKDCGKIVNNYELLKLNILEHMELLNDCTILIASKVLYHKNINKKQDALLRAIQKSKIKSILIQGHTVRGEYGQNEGIKKALNNIEFELKVIKDHEEYPISVATRRS